MFEWMLKGLKSEYRQDLVYQEMLSKEYDILTRVQHSDVIGHHDVRPIGQTHVQKSFSTGIVGLLRPDFF